MRHRTRSFKEIPPGIQRKNTFETHTSKAYGIRERNSDGTSNENPEGTPEKSPEELLVKFSKELQEIPAEKIRTNLYRNAKR